MKIQHNLAMFFLLSGACFSVAQAITFRKINDVNSLDVYKEFYVAGQLQRVADTPEFAELNQKYLIPFSALDVAGYFENHFKKELFKTEKFLLYGAFDQDDQLVGMCIVRVPDQKGGNYRLANITVRSDMWRRGIGVGLFSYMCDDLGQDTPELLFESPVRQSNVPFFTFLQKMGFVTDVAATEKCVQDTLASTAPQFHKDIMRDGDGLLQVARFSKR